MPAPASGLRSLTRGKAARQEEGGGGVDAQLRRFEEAVTQAASAIRGGDRGRLCLYDVGRRATFSVNRGQT
jgi:hypothetical protein